MTFKVTRHDGHDETTETVIHSTTAQVAREIADQMKREEHRGSSTYYTVDQD